MTAGNARREAGKARQEAGKARQEAGEAKQVAEGEGRRAGNSRPLVFLTRVGFIGYGVLHLTIAWLAVQIALGRRHQEGDQSGALSTLAGQPIGRALLGVVALGLAAMAVWQALVAVVGAHERKLDRASAAARAVVYAVLAFAAVRSVISGGPGSSAQKQQQATAGIMGHTAGVWLVGLIGLVVLGLGVGFIGYGLTRKFEDRLMRDRMGATAQAASQWLGAVGYAAKGVAYGIVGVLLVDAAVTHDPKKSRGLDAALHSLVQQPFGRVLLIVVGAGIAAFGAFCLFQSRYRKVGT